MEEYRGKVRLVLKNFPYVYRDYSYMYAEALLAAGDQGKYWEMHDALLKETPFLGRGVVIKHAEELGLDMKRFQSDLDSMKHRMTIEKDKALAESLGIYNTPTFFINGRRVDGNRSYNYLKKILDEELQNAEEKGVDCTFCHKPVSDEPDSEMLPGR
jgi:protein-disulfide isomerase